MMQMGLCMYLQVTRYIQVTDAYRSRSYALGLAMGDSSEAPQAFLGDLSPELARRE
jgi:hypothetical protein